jgi:hypothetical protein
MTDFRITTKSARLPALGVSHHTQGDEAMSKSNVVRLRDFREPPQKSQYERYPLPFFNRSRHSTWDVTPTGNYTADCKTGRAYAIEFLKSCDGTVGWSTLLSEIAADMIRAGTNGAFPDGHLKVNGIVIGFMGTIGSFLACNVAPRPSTA